MSKKENGEMRALEIARKLAALEKKDEACQAYALALQIGMEPAEQLEAAAYILQSGGNYKVSYTTFIQLYNRGCFREDILPLMEKAFYEPNIRMLKNRYDRNCKLLDKYPYIFRKDFLKFEELPIQFFPYDDHHGYVPYYRAEDRFGDFINFKETVIKHYFFKNLENPILAQDVYSQYELEYLRDNVRRSEDVARENHIYLHYTDWAEFCSYLTCLNLRPLLEEKKIVFLIEDEFEQYPIDFKKRFGIDYSQYTVKPIAIREVTRMIWHGQLSSHNGGDMFNEVFDAHPNLIAMPSILMTNIEETVQTVREALESCGSLAEALYSFRNWEEPRLIEELYHNRNRTDKDILIGLYLCRKEYSRFLDENSRIAPALFFQPHFTNIIYSLKADEKNRATLYSETYETVRSSPIFLGFKYIKTFTPMRRFTTSHGATVRFMDIMATEANNARSGDEDLATTVSDAVSERVLNRSFMIDRQDRIYRDSVVVRFEDGKLNTKATFTALAAFLDLPYTESMTYCSDQGERDPHPDTKGFDPAPVYKTYDEYVNDSERIFIEYFLRDAYAYYGYDFHYYNGEPMTEEQAKELLRGFTTIDSYMRKTWKLVFQQAKITQDGMPVTGLEESIQVQMLENYMENILKNRENIVEILMSDLRFMGKNGQPLYMMPKLELDPALLEQPLYH